MDIYDKLEGVGAVGGIVGTAVSASFLFLVAVINSWFLYDALRHRRARKAREAMGLPPMEDEAKAIHGGGCLVRIVGPILKAVDRPWKLYPVGILFGFVSTLCWVERRGGSEGRERDLRLRLRAGPVEPECRLCLLRTRQGRIAYGRLRGGHERQSSYRRRPGLFIAAQPFTLSPKSGSALSSCGATSHLTLSSHQILCPLGVGIEEYADKQGFDTASSIALLALSAIASRDHNGNAISHGKIVVLPFLFTAGMSLVDSLDSILMLYAYAQPELKVSGRWRLLEKRPLLAEDGEVVEEEREVAEEDFVGEVQGGRGHEEVRREGERVETAEGVVIVGPERERMDSYDFEGAEPVLPVVGPSTLANVDGDAKDSKDVKPSDPVKHSPSPGVTSNPFETPAQSPLDSPMSLPLDPSDPDTKLPPNHDSTTTAKLTAERAERAELEPNAHVMSTKTATMSSLSISLTLLSIAVALSISLIEIMGLIGEQCTPCREAAEAEDGGGLAGSWWRAWARANDASGYVGAAIVGCFVAILVVYHGVRWGIRRHKRRQAIEV